ncbi:hypothetical protein [Rathayibacter rathayi]|uniref:hypothetical protein n=1 Tax=Rathayibacter rathayi TaxID=33887 RepID=UPI000CE7D487|nr:hypothetical protein [Rathayibacter rathayi]PPF23646.1 hypothetical protein C5C34_07930 [Rathayibacter rathayi]PPI73999.1 hypothetical protein C5E12_03815 [Rathayibacter rathayi]
MRGRVFAGDTRVAVSAIAVSQFSVAGLVVVLDEVSVTRLLAGVVLVYGMCWWLATRRLRLGTGTAPA